MTVHADPVSTTLPVPAAQPTSTSLAGRAGRGRVAVRRLAAAVVLAAALAACSTPGEPAETGDPVDGTADIVVDDVGVEDGTEGGLDLDDGNVPGSQADQDLDPYDEQNGLDDEGTDEG